MRYSRIPGIADPISRCVLGTSGIRSEDKHRLLDAFLEAGGNCIDTARAYGGGSAEQSVGGWIRKVKPDGLIVIAKGAHPPNCRPEMVSIELTESLEKLGIDRADLYLLHRDDPSIPVAEFVDALDAEVATGRIGAYGASNWGQQRLAEANAYAAEQLASTGMVALSNHFSLALPKEPLIRAANPCRPNCANTSRKMISDCFPGRRRREASLPR
ncbi:MAG: aldo/keto reductase [Pseudonocardiaceae bacterium]